MVEHILRLWIHAFSILNMSICQSLRIWCRIRALEPGCRFRRMIYLCTTLRSLLGQKAYNFGDYGLAIAKHPTVIAQV